MRRPSGGERVWSEPRKREEEQNTTKKRIKERKKERGKKGERERENEKGGKERQKRAVASRFQRGKGKSSPLLRASEKRETARARARRKR